MYLYLKASFVLINHQILEALFYLNLFSFVSEPTQYSVVMGLLQQAQRIVRHTHLAQHTVVFEHPSKRELNYI